MKHIFGGSRSRVGSLVAGAAAVAAVLAAAGCSSAGGTAAAGTENVNLSGSTTTNAAAIANGQAAGFQVVTLNDHKDITFNQLLGINNDGVIAGYFGSGASATHPNKGYWFASPYAQSNYANENFPGSAQTQVIGINDSDVTVGFFANSAGTENQGFWEQNGRFHAIHIPWGNQANPQISQLLGINDTGWAVGFYNDAKGNAHGFAYNPRFNDWKQVNVKGATSVTAAGVNDESTITGFYTNSAGDVDGFVKWVNGKTVTLAVPGASSTNPTGINDRGEVVGTYTVGTGSSAVTHGFTWLNGKWTTVNYPSASSTSINGVNNEGDIVGFYTDASGNTDGFLGLPG
jgi:probable HAF family extracellular repeat protein